MRHWKRLLVIFLAAVVTAAAWATLFGPGLLRDRARAWVRMETGRALEIGQVSINLLSLSLELRDVTLTEPDQTTPFLSWERLYVGLSPRSLWHRAPVIRELQLDRPYLRIERRPEGRFNFSDLLERRTGEAAPAPDSEPARFSLNNLVIHGGRIEVEDRTLATPATHRLDELELAVPFVGNLPYLADRYVQPLLSTRVNGTRFELKGELKPFTDFPEYLVRLKFDGIDLPRYLAYLPAPLPVRVQGGRLYLNLELTWRAAPQTGPTLELAGWSEVTVLDLREADGRPLIFLPLVSVRFAPSRPLEKAFHLASLAIQRPQLWLEREAGGGWNVARLAGGGSGAKARAEAPETKPPPLQLEIDRLSLQNGRLSLRDRLPADGFSTTLTDVNLDVTGLTLAAGKPFSASLTLSSDRRERAAVSGAVTLNPFSCDLTVTLEDLPLPPYAPYYLDLYKVPLKGTLTARSRLTISPEHPLLLSGGHLEGRDLEMSFAAQEGLKVARLGYAGVDYDLAANRLAVAEITASGLDLRFSRSPKGQWSFFSGNLPLLAAMAETAAAPPPAQSERPPLSYRIGRVGIDDAKVAFRDDLPAEPVKLAVTGLAVNIKGLAAPEQSRADFQLQGTIQQRGTFQASGQLEPAGPEITADLQLRRIPLTDFSPYLGDRVRLVLVDGFLDTRLSARLARAGERWQGRLSGNLDIRRFYCLDAAHREDLLRWERLRVEGIDFKLAPQALKIASISLNDYYARVLLDEQARLNLAEVFAPEPAAPMEAPPAAAGADVRIDQITLQGGKVNFTDRHMPRPFSAEMLQLGGRIQGLSSVPGARAEIDLRGRLRNESPLSISGTLNPLADPLFLKIRFDFTDIDLNPLSPYAGTYVGYLIERGKLNVALEYLVENGTLQATNRIFLDQFTFGDKVESDKATSLPVRLAVALLKDRNGEIHLDIPVTGNIDDPQFSLWGLVWQVIKNLLVKAATSPLALLGALGGGGDDFSGVVFPYGSAQLDDAELAKLARIAEALRDRASLKVELKGYVDPDHDPEAYRRELLQERLRREKLIDLRKKLGDAAPAGIEAVTVASTEYPDYLWRIYKATDFPKPRNLVGMVKHLPDEELEKLLLAHTRVGAAELTALAQARAQAVAAALAGGGIPHERLFLTTTDVTASPADAASRRSRVEFGMALR